ncbi:metallophosphoesterase family protein [Bailinhaonella thermotolerans]|uniref:Metallophosphoesterase n=1 Tax=Bailinhaonella thermotolerans TaxID=1070861 RepID=A0A3A4BMV9_9ACTN|nr:metallophosphoesterase [Bailinhaonella thermotolerans]RJL32414.1 metallophosphoesterase [Bailinhaonella thermotolerans]
MTCVAAVADIHLGKDVCGRFRKSLEGITERAEVLLLGGDLTRHGTVEEGRAVADEFRDLGLPVVAVLGNHDYHSDAQDEITAMLEDAGVIVLEGDNVVLDLNGVRLGIAGTKGFGGGFAGRSASEFGEPEMKRFYHLTKELSTGLAMALKDLDTDLKIALTHYSPVKETLEGEPSEIYPFLGSYLLAEAIDQGDVDLAIHGHAHLGSERGVTPGGVSVRNVALPVLRQAYALYRLTGAEAM